ncbi:hypothetical protein [Morganella morganii]|uniref:hypothetical protein n=1 Tax=Morganella morganii TaxID=582 RepID=UPI0034D3BEE9
MKRLLAITFDLAIAGSFYFGITMNMDGLINVGYFAGWLFAVMNVLVGVIGKDKIAETYTHQSLLWRSYDVLTDVVFVAFFAYSGWFVLATTFAIGAMCKAGIKNVIEKDLAKSK